MPYCSRHHINVLMIAIFRFSEDYWKMRGYQWKQLVLPGFDQIMGV